MTVAQRYTGGTLETSEEVVNDAFLWGDK